MVHPQLVCESTEHLLDELARVEQLEGEGLMLRFVCVNCSVILMLTVFLTCRNPTAAHRGGRSSDLLKVKSFQDDEALIIDYEAGWFSINLM